MRIDVALKPSLITAYISLFGMMYYSYIIYKRDPKFFLLNILFFTAYIPAAISNVLNESFPNYLTELNQVSFLNGSLVINVFYFSILILGIKTAFISKTKRIILDRKFFSLSLLNKAKGLFLLLITILILSLIIYNSPLVLGINRLDYRINISKFPIQLILNLSNSLLYFIVIYYFFSKKKYNFYILFIVFCVVQILHGDRFSGLFFGFSIILITMAAFKNRFPPFSKVKYYIIIIVLLITLILFINVSFTSDLNPWGRIIIRYSLQSEVWWSTQNYVSNHPVDYSSFLSHGMGIGTDKNVSGINYMMKILAPDQVYNLYIERGSKFTMGAPSLLLVTLGPVFGGFAVFLSGCLCGRVLKSFVLSSNSTSYISGFFYLKAYLMTTYACIMGDYPKLISTLFFFYLLMAIITSGWKFSNSQLRRITF